MPSLAELRRGATTRLEALRTDFGRSSSRRLKATIPRPLGRGNAARSWSAAPAELPKSDRGLT